jgi:hypothetical protein
MGRRIAQRFGERDLMTADGDEDEGGSGLPAIVGTAAKVAETSVMKDLFGRAFKAAGDYYGEKVEEFFQKRRENRLRNVRDHELRVAQVIGEPVNILSKPEYGRAIERWVDVAADVPLEDAERAALFEAVLEQILSAHGTSDFQDIAERLSSSGMRVLLNAPSDHGIAPERRDRQIFERLRSLGLARSLDLGQALVVIFAWLLGTAAGFYILFGIIPRYLPRALAIEFIVEAVLISAVVLALGIALLSAKYRLTELGRSLQQAALRFYRSRSRLRVGVLSAIPSNPLVWGALAALLVSVLPPALESYLPAQLRTGYRPTVIISSVPPTSSSGPVSSPPAGRPTPTPPRPEQTTVLADEVGTLIAFWNGIKDQMDGIIGLTDQGQSLVKTWPQDIRSDRGVVLTRLASMRDSINQRRSSLQALTNLYQRYPNVQSALNPGDDILAKLHFALDVFFRETQTLPTPPENFEGRITPYANGLKNALGPMEKWANSTRDFAKLQSEELSQGDNK